MDHPPVEDEGAGPRTRSQSNPRDHDRGRPARWRALKGSKGYAFPSPIDPKKHITRESLEKVYRVTLELEDRHTPHGWRSAFSTLAREEGHFERDVVELALDHIHDNDVVRAYDRGERLQKRIELMTWWDAELARAQQGAEVLPFKRAAKK